MVLVDFLFAFLVAFVLSIVLVSALGWGLPGRDAPWASVLLLFFVLFLAAWAGGLWVRPIGPTLWGVHWLGFLLVGLIIAVVMAAATPRRKTPAGGGSAQAATEVEEEQVAFGTFIWLLLVVLTVAILARYLWT